MLGLRRVSSGLVLLLSGLVILVVACGIIPAVSLFNMLSQHAGATRFVVPGSVQIRAEEPGRYYLWDNYRTVYEGRVYRKSSGLPDQLMIRFTNETAETVPFISGTAIHLSIGESQARSIGFVELAHPGVLVVDVEGDAEDRVFSVGRFELKPIGETILTAMVSAVVGMALCAWGIIRLCRNRLRPARQGELAEPPAG